MSEVFLFDAALVIPGPLIDVVSTALTRYVDMETRAGRTVDPALRPFADSLRNALTSDLAGTGQDFGADEIMEVGSSYVGVTEAARLMNRSERHVRRLARQIPGAHQISNRWLIPTASLEES